jgi:hypothetical protein
MGIGVGCCVSARLYSRGTEFDFASLPDELKIRAVRQIREGKTERAGKAIVSTPATGEDKEAFFQRLKKSLV